MNEKTIGTIHEEYEARRASALAEARRAFNGAYGLLLKALEVVEAEERLGRKNPRGSSSYGTRAQDLILLTAARLVLDDPNGCQERFAHLLDATIESRQDLDGRFAPRLCRQPYGSTTYEPVRATDHFLDRARETARKIVDGEE